MFGMSGVRGTDFRTAVAVLFLLCFVMACGGPRELDQVRKRGELVVATRYGPTTYYQGPEGPLGPEYELLAQFADYLGVRLRVETYDTAEQVLAAVVERRAAVGAAGLSATQVPTRVRYGPSYQVITRQLVHHQARPLPSDLLQGRDAPTELTPEKLRARYPRANWAQPEEDAGEGEELLQRVMQGDIDYAVVDSNVVAINRRYWPELRVGLNLGPARYLRWAFVKGADLSLYDQARAYFAWVKKSGRLAGLITRYYGDLHWVKPADTRIYYRHIRTRLPRYRMLFEQAGLATGIDWRLLAAVGYQESQWLSDATSPTGVRGLMMLTEQTARRLGVRDRLDAAESIQGGARYLALIRDDIDADIAEPARTWFALAAYNLGYGHLEDARRLAAASGTDPDVWPDVQRMFPLLVQPRWYRHTRHGYANGVQALHFVRNVRNYYDILIWDMERGRMALEAPFRPTLAMMPAR